MKVAKNGANKIYLIFTVFTPFYVLIILSPFLSMLYKALSLSVNKMSLVGLVVIIFGVLIGITALIKVEAIPKGWKILIFLLYFPAVLFSLLLAGF